MKVKIKRVWGADIARYKIILDKHNASYVKEDNESVAIVEIENLIELFSLAKELDEDLTIIHNGDNVVEIYDGYID